MGFRLPLELAGRDDIYRGLSLQESEVLLGPSLPWNCSITGWWSWKGAIVKKLLGRMPTPTEVDLPHYHPFFDQDFVDRTEVRNAQGELLRVEYWHHGRQLKPDHKLVLRFERRAAQS